MPKSDDKRRGQVFLITAWILIIITLLAVSIGHKVSLGLRLSRNRRDSFQAACLAKAGFTTAVNELIKDKTGAYDSLEDTWADNETLFSKIKLNDMANQFSTVGFTTIQAQDAVVKYGVIDEERKININTSSRGTLLALFQEYGIEKAPEIAEEILIWRGDIPDEKKIYAETGYLPKSGSFVNTEELIMVKDVTAEVLNKLKGAITVYTKGLLNINTVSYETLEILCRGAAKELGLEESFADGVAGKIIELRQKQRYFKNKEALSVELTGEEQINIYNKIIPAFIYKSDNFLIEVLGNVGKIKRRIIAVYNRESQTISYWHEG